MVSIYYNRTQDERLSILDLLKQRLPTNKHTEVFLDISFAGLNPLYMKAICDALHSHNITRLNLSYACIDDAAANMLSHALKASKVRDVVLRGNVIRDHGAIALADAIHHKPTLTIDVTKNKIGPQGGAALAKAIAETNARKIDLSENELSDKGAEAVAKVLKAHPGNINQLVLKFNDIGDIGDKALADNVPSHIAISFRTKKVTVMEKYPVASIIACIFCPILFFFLYFWPAYIDIDGCKTEQKRRQTSTL